MKFVPEKESAKKHGLENTNDTSASVKGQKTTQPPQAKKGFEPKSNEPAKKHGKEENI